MAFQPAIFAGAKDQCMIRIQSSISNIFPLCSLRKCGRYKWNLFKQSCLLIGARGIGKEIQKPFGTVNGLFNQPHIALGDRFQLFHNIPEQGCLGFDFQSYRLFEAVGEFRQSKLFSRNPEIYTQILTKARHLSLQTSEFDIERFLRLIAFQDCVYAALYEQSCFAPRMLNEITIGIDLFANDSQEF
jgi:hypothetical protein